MFLPYYFHEIGNKAVLKRLGYLSETLSIEKPLDLLRSTNLSAGYSRLDPSVKKRGYIMEKWKLIVNVPIDPSKWLT